MSLKKVQKDALVAMGIDIDAIIAAHADAAEKDITIPAGTFMTDAQLTTRDGEKLKDGEKSGEQKAFTIAITEIKNHAGIELKGKRWGDVGVELKAAMNATGDDKIKTLTDQNALLLNDKTTLTSQLDSAKNGLKRGMQELDIIARIPAGSDMTARERFEIAKIRGYAFEETDGKLAIKKNGEFLKDKTTHAVLPIDQAIPVLLEEQKWNAIAAAAPQGGRGTPQKPVVLNNTGIKTRSQAEAAWKEQNPNSDIATPEGMAWYNELAKAKDFNMYE